MCRRHEGCQTRKPLQDPMQVVLSFTAWGALAARQNWCQPPKNSPISLIYSLELVGGVGTCGRLYVITTPSAAVCATPGRPSSLFGETNQLFTDLQKKTSNPLHGNGRMKERRTQEEAKTLYLENQILKSREAGGEGGGAAAGPRAVRAISS